MVFSRIPVRDQFAPVEPVQGVARRIGDDQAARAVGRLLDDRIGTIKGTLNGGPDDGQE